MFTKKNYSLILFFFLAISVSQAAPPKLIVFISIDQMRADYFERYGEYFTGGFKRLYSKGILYSNADLNYATSETGPGHATLGTGCYPRQSGIVANNWINESDMKDVYCVEDSNAGEVDGAGGGASARNLEVNGIGDWLKMKSPKSKVFSVSSKDRAAILMGGKHPDYAFWYSKSVGGLVTSDYYIHSLPKWVKSFNNAHWAKKNVPDVWVKSLSESLYNKIGPDEFEAEKKWGDNRSFPHEFNPLKKEDQMIGSPYGDKFIVDFAKDAVIHEKLGQRGVTDLLCISLSNCDYVGHDNGPDSHEMFDLLIKIDEYLGELFSFLEKKVGKDKFIIALSADHAVCPLPEFNSQFRNIPAKRYIYSTEIKPKLDSLNISLKKEFNTDEDVIIKNSFVNYLVGTRAGLDSIKFEDRITTALLSIDAYVEIYFRRELITNTPSNKLFIQKYRNSYYAPRGEDYQYRIKENCIISWHTYGTGHGSPYDYDTHVPIIFWREGIQPQKISREVYTVDIAPTLAKYAGFGFPKKIDGNILKEVTQ